MQQAIFNTIEFHMNFLNCFSKVYDSEFLSKEESLFKSELGSIITNLKFVLPKKS